MLVNYSGIQILKLKGLDTFFYDFIFSVQKVWLIRFLSNFLTANCFAI